MSAIQKIDTPVVSKIYTAWIKRGTSEDQRKYLGASIIGHECERYLWLYFRGAFREVFDGRMYRLFDRGNIEETRFVQDLRDIGCEVKDRDENGNQFSVSALGGHFGGHMDGVVRGLPDAPKTWHNAEFKTHNEASFKALVKNGVKAHKPMHYAQMRVYMGLSGLTRALYLAVNKNTDELYSERVEFNKGEHDLLMDKAKRVITSSECDRCSSRPDDYRCKACPAASVCWNKSREIIDPNLPITCRTCCHATADVEHDGASWTCAKGHSCASNKTCEEYLALPSFVNAELIDGTRDALVFRIKDCDFKMGKDGFSAYELKKLSNDEMPSVNEVKKSVKEAEVVRSSSIVEKAKSLVVLFSGSAEETRGWCAANPYINWSAPTRTEAHDYKTYIEYPLDTIIVVHGDTVEVRGEEPPF